MKKLFALMSVLMVASMLLAACGTAATPTPAPAVTVIGSPEVFFTPGPTATATAANLDCGWVEYDMPGTCVNGIAILDFKDGTKVFVDVKATSEPGNNNMTKYTVTTTIEREDNDAEVALGACTYGNSNESLEYPATNTFYDQYTMYIPLKCVVTSQKFLNATLVLPIQSSIKMTLTAMPSATPAVTGTPTSAIKTATSTTTATFTPSAPAKTATPAATGTHTITPKKGWNK